MPPGTLVFAQTPPLSKRQLAFWLGAMVVTWFAFGVTSGDEPLWLDETYSYAMTQHSVTEVLTFTQRDVHPPLYYVVLKISTSLFGTSPGALRIPSVLASVGLLALAMGPVRHIWGNRAAVIFAILVVTSPGVLCFAREARMYALTTFSVTGAFLYGQLALRQPRSAHLVALSLFTWTAAMSHYFGLLAAGMNGLSLLVMARSNVRGRVVPLLVALGMSAIAYLPWLTSFMAQVSSVAKGFWIPPTSFELLVFGLVAPFTYKFEDIPYPWQAIASLVLLSALVAVTLTFPRWRRRGLDTRAVIRALAIFALTLGFGLAFSRLVQPIFMPRYMMSCAGLLLLATAVALSSPLRPSVSVLGTGLFVALGLPAWLRIQTQTFNGPFELLAAEVAAAGLPAPLLLHNDGQALYPSWYAIPGADHAILSPKGSSSDPTSNGLFDGKRLLSGELASLMNTTDRIWVIDAEPAARHVDLQPITNHPRWIQASEPSVLELPMSWVKLRVLRYAKR